MHMFAPTLGGSLRCVYMSMTRCSLKLSRSFSESLHDLSPSARLRAAGFGAGIHSLGARSWVVVDRRAMGEHFWLG